MNIEFRSEQDACYYGQRLQFEGIFASYPKTPTTTPETILLDFLWRWSLA
jgi:hypothetical protein